MKRFTVAEARARFGDVLDEADQGETVIIERRGVQYTVTPRKAPRTRAAAKGRYFEWVDPAVINGQWTWTSTKSGLRFAPRGARKKR
jgi:antitoxin (DNA-binding transcriptional repressor) of toxin-antitoxin stability system